MPSSNASWTADPGATYASFASATPRGLTSQLYRAARGNTNIAAASGTLAGWSAVPAPSRWVADCFGARLKQFGRPTISRLTPRPGVTG